MPIYNSVLEMIGSTPLLRLGNIGQNLKANIFAKLEILNPSSSVKDRISLYMVQKAMKEGKLQVGGTVIEATAGNTGIGLALVCSALKLDFICIMPQKYSIEKQKFMEFMGAKVIRTPTEEGMDGAIALGRKMALENKNHWFADQFDNQDNPDCHYMTTGKEIWEQTGGKVTHVLVGAGTGGTFTGIARYLKEKNPNVKAYVVEPEGSTIGGGVSGPHWVEGIGNDYIPKVLDMSLCDGVIMVMDSDSKAMIKNLARQEQLMVGGSSGANVFAAMKLAENLGVSDQVVTLIPDRLERYVSKGILDL